MWNTNEQYASWDVLRNAIRAVFAAMELNAFGTGRFTFYDGVREVGEGTIT